MSHKIVTLGEIMLRLSTPGFSRFVQAQSFDVTYGGGEANVAVSLANYGLQSYFVTKLPANEIGQAALNHLRRFGVNVDYIVRGGDRLGIYFLESGASQRPSKVIYDRAHSAVSELKSAEVDWQKVFENAIWFHWTGITPALGELPQECLEEACKAARAAGATISCDLNFRKKLWTPKQAQAKMRPLMEYVDVCIANEEDAEKSLGLNVKGSDVDQAKLDEAAYFEIAENLKGITTFRLLQLPSGKAFRLPGTVGVHCCWTIEIAKRPTIPVITTFKLSTVLAAEMLLPVHSSLHFSVKRIRKMPWSLRLPHPASNRQFPATLTW